MTSVGTLVAPSQAVKSYVSSSRNKPSQTDCIIQGMNALKCVLSTTCDTAKFGIISEELWQCIGSLCRNFHK